MPRVILRLILLLVAVNVAQVQADFFGPSRDVESVSVEELQALMAGKGPQGKIVLVDVRSPGEIAVSMIPGAISRSEFEASRDQYRGTEVITYCTVGARSADYAEKLLDDGFQARNYAGSILDWVGAGLSLVTPDGEPTRRVHVYSKRFSVPPPYEAVTQ
ncbi:MAG: rhodanese-like domain-containing protein [Chromatocurvus sp.]